MPERPQPGAVTTSEVRIRTCRYCATPLSGSMCNRECMADLAARDERNTVVAIYQRTDTFLRDEELGRGRR